METEFNVLWTQLLNDLPHDGQPAADIKVIHNMIQITFFYPMSVDKSYKQIEEIFFKEHHLKSLKNFREIQDKVNIALQEFYSQFVYIPATWNLK